MTMRLFYVGLALSTIACQAKNSSLGDLPRDDATAGEPSDTDAAAGEPSDTDATPGEPSDTDATTGEPSDTDATTGEPSDTDADDDMTATTGDEVCAAEGAGVAAFFTVDFGTFPISNPNRAQLLDIPCTVDDVSVEDDEATTAMSCSADEALHAVTLTHPVPPGSTPDWAAGDDVLLSADLLEEDFFLFLNITASLRSSGGDLLFAGVGDLVEIDRSGGEVFGIPNDQPADAVLIPLTIEPDREFCDIPFKEVGPIAVAYALMGESTLLVGNSEGELSAADRTYEILQERAHLTSSNDALFALQLCVVATTSR